MPDFGELSRAGVWGGVPKMNWGNPDVSVEFAE
jgi:hypothetical protein